MGKNENQQARAGEDRRSANRGSDETLTAHCSRVAVPLLNMRTPSMSMLSFKLDVGLVDVVVIFGHFSVEYSSIESIGTVVKVAQA